MNLLLPNLKIKHGAEYITDKHQLVGTIDNVAYVRANKTEPYVCIPPAFIITDSDGAAWSLSEDRPPNGNLVHHGEFQFKVMRNDFNIDDMYATRIEYRNGVITIYGDYGKKQFSRNRRHFI